MKVDESLFEVREELSGWDEVEVFYKRGRSRTVRTTQQGEVTSFRREEGWAVRVGDPRRSFFYAASGPPRPGAAWPEADGQGLRLPPARPVRRWSAPSALDAPLLSESEARGFFEAVARELDNELPGARLLSGQLEDGSSESQLLSSREVAATVRHRAASLRLEAVGSGGPGAVEAGLASVTLELAEREARRFAPTALARRLADRLLIMERGTAPRRDRGELLLAPPVAAGLIAALSKLWIGPESPDRVAALLDRRGRLGSPAFTLIDDGRLAGGIFDAPVDGEGQPTREVVLVEEGVFEQPLLAWWQAASDPRRASGCARRPGWRDLPRPSPTHLYLRRDSSASVVSLLGEIRRGYYLLALEGEPCWQDGRFAAPVAGFAIDGGRPTGPVSGAVLTGTVQAFLGGVLAVARDLTFFPVAGGLVGAPTLLVRGLEIRRS